MARPKTKLILNYIQRFSSYRTVNTLRLSEIRFGVFKAVLSSCLAICDSLYTVSGFQSYGRMCWLLRLPSKIKALHRTDMLATTYKKHGVTACKDNNMNSDVDTSGTEGDTRRLSP